VVSRSRPLRGLPRGLGSAEDCRPCGLMRVSTDEQADQFSLPMQVEKIVAYCREQLGAELPEAALFREEGVSGWPGTLKKRPGLAAALEACRAGRYTHLVVHKLDRLGRNVGLVSAVLEELEALGVVFVSVQDKVDASTAAGRLYIAIFIAIAQWYSDNLSEETKKGKEGRKREGLYNGILPFGAMRGEGPHAAPLPDLRPLSLLGSDGMARETTKHAGLLQALEWCAQGCSARDIAVKLNQVGYRTAGTWGSNPFSKDTVQRLLGNRFYLGELPDGKGGWMPGKHTPLVPQDLWDAAQRARARQRANPQTIPGTARVHVLGGGLLRCGMCYTQGRSSALHVAKSRKEEDTAYFSCYGRFQGYACTQPSIPAHELEAQVAAFFDAFALPDDYQRRMIELYEAEQHHASSAADELDVGTRRAQLEARLERQQQLFELGDWTRERYLQARREVLMEIAALDERALGRPEEDPEALSRLGAYVREVHTAWQDADKANRRLLVRTLFEQLWVVGERIVAVKPAPQFAPFFRVLQRPDPTPDGGVRTGLWISPSSAWAGDITAVAALASELARGGEGAEGVHETLEHNGAHDNSRRGLTLVTARVQTSGPDGRGNRAARNGFAASSVYLAADEFSSSSQSLKSERRNGQAWFVRPSSMCGTCGRTRAVHRNSWTSAGRGRDPLGCGVSGPD